MLKNISHALPRSVVLCCTGLRMLWVDRNADAVDTLLRSLWDLIGSGQCNVQKSETELSDNMCPKALIGGSLLKDLDDGILQSGYPKKWPHP